MSDLILDRVINVARLTKDTGNTSKESYQNHTPLLNISINVQPGTAEDTVIANGVFGQTYIGFTTYSGVLSGDRLTDTTSGEQFMVKGKTNWMTPTLIPHIELLLVKLETVE